MNLCPRSAQGPGLRTIERRLPSCSLPTLIWAQAGLPSSPFVTSLHGHEHHMLTEKFEISSVCLCRSEVLGICATWRPSQQGAVRSYAALHHQRCRWQGWRATHVSEESGPHAGRAHHCPGKMPEASHSGDAELQPIQAPEAVQCPVRARERGSRRGLATPSQVSFWLPSHIQTMAEFPVSSFLEVLCRRHKSLWTYCCFCRNNS